MCGIAGIAYFDGRKANPAVLKRMTDILAHRGPDGDGHWFSEEGNIALGHRRLAIIDLSQAARQPMEYSGRYVITLNGEIYNYIELRENLKKKGYQFNTQSDTEVLLALFQAYGEECLPMIDGMFAFCIFDKKEKKLFAARDRFGEKPFYYQYFPGHSFVFASEVKGLFAGGVPFQENMDMMFYYLAYQVVENPFDKKQTFFQDIFTLEAAHYLILDQNGKMTCTRYWELPSRVFEKVPFPGEAAEEVRSLIHLSVQRRLRSDVPVGSSLSGGLDSSTVVWCINDLMPEEDKGLQNTFTARFDDPFKDEGKYVQYLTSNLKLNSYQTWVTGYNFTDDLDKIFWHQEEPIGGVSPLAQWEVMKLASRHGVTVLLDGQGADEVFAGYMHYFYPFFRELYLNNHRKFIRERKGYEKLHNTRFRTGPSFIMEALRPGFLREIGEQRRKLVIPSYLSDLNADFANRFKHLPPPFKSFRNLNDTLSYSTSVYGLGKLLKLADRNSMAFSREVRLPFLFHTLVEYIFQLPSTYKICEGWTKWILRKAFEGSLPDEITWRKDKLGYEPPVDKWLQIPWVKEKIDESIFELQREKLISKPLPAKKWLYWNAHNFLYEFKNQINQLNDR
ncbi:MAG: asparagine synthase (glutamine-hydrolyzing) [Bacteroidetes bacterium]|nr:asparagine synthase (glutamine-hydrolyzing) [Bacteroidota bacterium]